MVTNIATKVTIKYTLHKNVYFPHEITQVQVFGMTAE